MRVPHRVAQFFRHLRRAPLPLADQHHIAEVLGPTLTPLFFRMTPGEQLHSLTVLRRVEKSAPPELLQAALLHDVGKSVAAMNIFERVLVVLAQHAFPNRWSHWGHGEPCGWRKPFVVTVQHARWGADLAAQAGAAPTVVNLIRRHQSHLQQVTSAEDELLIRLQAADDES